MNGIDLSAVDVNSLDHNLKFVSICSIRFLVMVLLSTRQYSMAHNLLGASTHGWAAVWWWLTHHRLIGWYRHKLSCGTNQNIYYSSWKRQFPSTINFTAKGDCAGIKINVFSRESSRVESTHSLRHSRPRKDAGDGGENPAGLSTIHNAPRKIKKLHRPSCWYTKKNKQQKEEQTNFSTTYTCELLL